MLESVMQEKYKTKASTLSLKMLLTLGWVGWPWLHSSLCSPNTLAAISFPSWLSLLHAVLHPTV
jgi:hypothetical protein